MKPSVGEGGRSSVTRIGKRVGVGRDDGGGHVLGRRPGEDEDGDEGGEGWTWGAVTAALAGNTLAISTQPIKTAHLCQSGRRTDACPGARVYVSVGAGCLSIEPDGKL